jgi:two-component system, chemotaxis family, CheB/CheR fusion protein
VTRIVDPESIRGLYLITLQPAAHPPVELDARSKSKRRKTAKGKRDPVAQLERELQYTRESLQTTVEELETSNEELKSTNEELQSTNEELQSSNEELETSKEEMQSLNEELNTVNNQMQGKLDELSHANDDLHNLLNSSEIATIFLDMELRVKRFTDSSRQVARLIPADLGRDVGDVKINLVDYDALEADSQEVLRTLVPKATEVRTPKDQTFELRIIPYRTVENLIDGVVITLIETTSLNAALALSESVVETVREPLVVLDEDLRVVQCNRAFLRTFDLREGQVVGELIYDASGGAWDNVDLRTLLEELLPQQTTIENFEFSHRFPRVGKLRLLLNARRLNRASGLNAMILLAAEIVQDGP